MEEEEHIVLFDKSKNYWNAKDETKRNKKHTWIGVKNIIMVSPILVFILNFSPLNL